MHAFPSRFLRAFALSGLLLGSVLPTARAQAPLRGEASTAADPALPAEPAATSSREIEWYTAEVPVTSQESRERDAALGRALAQVLVRVSGDLAAPNDPVAQRALRVAETLVVAAEYRDVEEIAGGVPVQRQLLAASFDPEAVDALVVAAGLPLWAGERPRPMLWLAVDDGGGAGPRLVSAQQINVVKPLAQRGLERGVRLLLPAGTAVEQPAAGSIWALDAAAVHVLSSRYGARVQLLGKVGRAGAEGWTSEWLLAEGGTEIARWSVTDPSPQRAIAAGADRAADALAARQARRVPAGRAEVLDAELVGIDSASMWLELAGYLQSLPVLRGLDVVEARPDALRVRLDLAVDRARFEALLAGSGRLVPVAGGVSSGADRRPIVRYRVAR